jgi:hypothetical protein
LTIHIVERRQAEQIAEIESEIVVAPSLVIAYFVKTLRVESN